MKRNRSASKANMDATTTGLRLARRPVQVRFTEQELAEIEVFQRVDDRHDRANAVRRLALLGLRGWKAERGESRALPLPVATPNPSNPNGPEAA